MQRDHLAGVYVYGALAIAMLFAMSWIESERFAMLLTVAAAGSSYAASVTGYANLPAICNTFVGLAVAFGLLAFGLLIV